MLEKGGVPYSKIIRSGLKYHRRALLINADQKGGGTDRKKLIHTFTAPSQHLLTGVSVTIRPTFTHLLNMLMVYLSHYKVKESSPTHN